MRRTPLRWAGATGLLLAALLTLSGVGIGQQPSAGRQLMQEVALPAIDRGIRDQDPPRPPRTGHEDHVRTDSSREEPVYLPGSVIVKYKGQASFDVVDIPMTLDAEAAAETLRGRNDVEYAQPRYVNHSMQFTPNDPMYPSQWNFPAIDMQNAWSIQPGATSDIIVAVLDSGVAFRSGTIQYNSRFQFRLVPGGPVYPALGLVNVPFAAAPELGPTGSTRFVAPHGFIWDDDVPVDLDGHGTHVSGTVGQLTNNSLGVAGMAFNVRIMPVKVIAGTWDEIFGSPNLGTDDVVARGIRYAADNGAKVINMSIGRTNGGPAPVVREAIEYTVGKGAFLAIASGNTRDVDNAANRIAEFAPQINGMVSVAAVGRTLNLAYYSTTGPWVEIAAPGGDQRQGGTTAGILQQTLDPDLLDTYERPPALYGPPRADAFVYAFFQGTSMATPHVSGFAALLMQQGITSPAAVEAAMKQFATDKGPPGPDDQYGAGLINPRLTLRGLGLAR